MNDSDTTCTQLAKEEKGQPRPVEHRKPVYRSHYSDDAWEVTVRLPGVKKGDVTVTVENEILEVNAARVFEAPESWTPLGDYAAEKHYQLRLDVGPEVDPARVSASLENGVLALELPLREEIKPRSIEVK